MIINLLSQKSIPLLLHGVELFYYQQEWGNGGTATSYFVPHNIDYTRYVHLKLKEGDILDKIPFLEKNAPKDGLKPSFLGLFKAGLDSKNLPLMHHALENYYKPNMIEWYKVHYSNPTKENFLKKIEQTKEELNTSISLALTAYSDLSTKEPLNFKDKNAEYYYCAFVGYGTDFNIANKINSIEEFNKNIKWLNKMGSNSDANYYKVANLNQQIILHGYSMKKRELREIIKLDTKERVSYKKTFKPQTNGTKECHWNYESKDKLLTSTETCNDYSKRVFFYHLSEEKGESFYKLLSYKNNKLVEKVLFDDSIYEEKIYDGNGILLSTHNIEGSLYDTCIPFQSYRVEVK